MIIIPLSLTEKEVDLLLDFDNLTCGVSIEGVIALVALNTLYPDDPSLNYDWVLAMWDATIFCKHVDNETIDYLRAMLKDIIDMFKEQMQYLLRYPILYTQQSDVKVVLDFKYNNLLLSWGLHEG